MKLAEQIKQNYLRADLAPRSKALAKFADLVTRTPSAVRKQDIDSLRKHGLSDRDILDAVEVIAYFNSSTALPTPWASIPNPKCAQPSNAGKHRTHLARRPKPLFHW